MAETSQTISCPSCQKQFAFKPGLVGKTVKCPKCANPFVVQAPETSYDLAPEAPRPAEPAVRYVPAPPKPVSDAQSSGPSAASVLANSARIGARGGLVGLLIGLGLGGVFLAFQKRPKVLLWIIIGVIGVPLVGCIGLGVLSVVLHSMLPARQAQPAIHPTMAPAMGPGDPGPANPGAEAPIEPVAPAVPPAAPGPPSVARGARGMPPRTTSMLTSGADFPTGPVGGGRPDAAPPTYESLVARMPADRVVRMTIDNVTDPQRQPPMLMSVVGRMGPANYSVTFANGQAQCVFGIPLPWDNFLQTIPPFIKITSTDPATHTISARMESP